MNINSSYFHLLDGRMRIKINEVKGSPVRAQEIENKLLEISGIEYITANPTTGNVLILYDHHQIHSMQIINALKDLGYLHEDKKPPLATKHQKNAAFEGLSQKFFKGVAYSIVEVALQNLVSALI